LAFKIANIKIWLCAETEIHRIFIRYVSYPERYASFKQSLSGLKNGK